MLFEALVTGQKPKAPSGTAILEGSKSKPGQGRRATLGGIVLVASKVLRSLALLSAYHAFHAGLSYPWFASCTLAIASVVLLALQQPWIGSPVRSPRTMLKLCIQSILLAVGFVTWASGLHLCGPAVTMMLEYVEVILLRLWVMLKDRESGSPFQNGKVGHALRSLALFGAACLVIVWERLPSPPAAARDSSARLEYGWEGSVDAGGMRMDNETASGASAQEAAAPIFDFDARSAGEFASGMFMLLMASAISAARKVQAESVARAVGGPKRLFAFSAPLSAIGLLPFLFYAHSAESKVTSSLAFMSEWHHIPLFAVMGLLMPFYAGNFADKNLPGGESARVGLFASVMSFICTWAVRMSPVELSSRVVAITVAFVVMALGEDARDDSVPLGVYSVPGIRGESSGWSSFLSRGRAYAKQMLTNRQSRRIASFLFINFTFMGIEFVYGWWTNSLGLISDAVHMLFDCGALVLGLYGSLMSTWWPNTTYTYGYGRYEVLCGFANGVLLMVIAVFIFFEALGRLFEPPSISTDRLLVVSVCGFLVNVVGLIVFSDVGHGHSHGAGGTCPLSKPKGSGGGHGHAHGPGGSCSGHGHAHGDAVSKPKALKAKGLLDKTGEVKTVAKNPKQALGVVHGYLKSGWSALTSFVGKFMSVEGHDANMQAVYLHVLADTLGSAGVIISSICVEYKGWVIADPICSLCIGSVIFFSVLPLVAEAGGTLLQRTPPELADAVPMIKQELLGMHGVVVEDMHVWRQSSAMIVGTLHLQVQGDITSYHDIMEQAQAILKKHGVIEPCVQIELVHKGGNNLPTRL